MLQFALCTRILSYDSARHINICMLAGAHIRYIAFDFKLFYTKLSSVFRFVSPGWLTVFIPFVFIPFVCMHAYLIPKIVFALLFFCCSNHKQEKVPKTKHFMQFGRGASKRHCKKDRLSNTKKSWQQMSFYLVRVVGEFAKLTQMYS